MATRYRYRDFETDIDVTRAVETHPSIREWRDRLVERGLSPARAQQHAERLLIAALDDFAGAYLSEVDAALDAIVNIREEIREMYDAVLIAEHNQQFVVPQRFRTLMDELEARLAAIDDATARRYLEDVDEFERPTPRVDAVIDELQASRTPPGESPLFVESPPTPEAIAEARDPFTRNREGLPEPDRQPSANAIEDGLDVLRRQNVSPDLLNQIQALRESQPDWVIAGILAGIGRTLEWRQGGRGGFDQAAWRGVATFLQYGGDPRLLLRILDWPGSEYTAIAATQALARLENLRPSDFELLRIVLRQREGAQATNTLIGLLRWVPSDQDLREVLSLVSALEPRATGLSMVLAYLGSRGENLNIGAWGTLRAARAFLQQNPGSVIHFEAPLEGEIGYTRIPDFRLELPSNDPRGLLFVEVKEILSVDVLSDQAVQQFGRDVVNQLDFLEQFVVIDARGERIVVLPEWMPHALSRMRWVVRNPALNRTPPTDPIELAQFEWEMEEFRQGVVNRLSQSFNRLPLVYHPLSAWAWDAMRTSVDDIILFQ